jgi:hypothetical protein
MIVRPRSCLHVHVAVIRKFKKNPACSYMVVLGEILRYREHSLFADDGSIRGASALPMAWTSLRCTCMHHKAYQVLQLHALPPTRVGPLGPDPTPVCATHFIILRDSPKNQSVWHVLGCLHATGCVLTLSWPPSQPVVAAPSNNESAGPASFLMCATPSHIHACQESRTFENTCRTRFSPRMLPQQALGCAPC